jgi:hypothetical protein
MDRQQARSSPNATWHGLFAVAMYCGRPLAPSSREAANGQFEKREAGALSAREWAIADVPARIPQDLRLQEERHEED